MKLIYLYVKTHNVTGLKYFGKTTNTDVDKYLGSGTYWRRHLEKHGHNVSTTIVGEFFDKNKAKEFAITFSCENDIVNSEHWANLKIECLDGGWDHITSEHIKKGIQTIRAKPIEEQQSINNKKARRGKENGMFGRDTAGKNNPRYGAKVSEEQKAKQSEKMKNRVNGIDSVGVIHHTYVDDERFKTGELKTLNKGKVLVKDKEGKVFFVAKGDARFTSGEVMSVNTGKTRTEQQRAHLSAIVKKLKWFNNGEISIRRDCAPDVTWHPGRLKNKSSS